MTFICNICSLEAEVPDYNETCPERPWHPYVHGHDWYSTEDKLYRISVSGGTKYNKDYQSGFCYGANPTEAWSNFCRLWQVNPRAFKNAYIYELKEIKDVIWYLKPEHNVVYA